jgi:ornithine carbamoyltransferase
MKATMAVKSINPSNSTSPSINPSKTLAPLTVANPYQAYINETALRGRDIDGIAGMTIDEIELVLECAKALKKNPKDPAQKTIAAGKAMAMLFEKPSLRTRVTFEVGMAQLGGTALFLEGKLGEREAICDVAANLARWVDVIMARVFDHATITELGKFANIPVINGLSDIEHPCQALADLLTIKEHKGKLKGLNIAYVGDANNVSNSLMIGALKMGANFAIACPTAFAPTDEMICEGAKASKEGGGKLSIYHDPLVAVERADVVYTDTWVSMGLENETEMRKLVFAPFQVNSTIVSYAKPDAIVMHCLPAHRGVEITDEQLDGPQSVVLDQAENRLHAQKALLTLIL